MRLTYHITCCLALLSLSTYALAEAPSTPTLWQQKANLVCAQLNTTIQAYQTNDTSKAHVNAVMAYFQNYDVNIEPTARLYFDQGHIFDIEQRFNALNQSIVTNPNPSQITDVTQQANQLCQIIMTDAKTMDASATPAKTGVSS